MERNFSEVYYDVEKAMDLAFEGKFVLKFYDYLKIKSALRYEVEAFIESATAHNLSEVVMDLDEYLKGGDDNEHRQLREGYGHIPKPQARKIRNYLYGILEDAWNYSNEKRTRKRKKKSK